VFGVIGFRSLPLILAEVFSGAIYFRPLKGTAMIV
jgi:hypothetical protein